MAHIRRPSHIDLYDETHTYYELDTLVGRKTTIGENYYIVFVMKDLNKPPYEVLATEAYVDVPDLVKDFKNGYKLIALYGKVFKARSIPFCLENVRQYAYITGDTPFDEVFVKCDSMIQVETEILKLLKDHNIDNLVVVLGEPQPYALVDDYDDTMYGYHGVMM